MAIKYKFFLLTCFFILCMHSPLVYATEKPNELQKTTQSPATIEKTIPYYSFLVGLEKKVTMFAQSQQKESIQQMKKSITYQVENKSEKKDVNLSTQAESLYGKDESLTSPIRFGATVKKNQQLVNGTFQYDGKDFVAICVVFDGKCYSSRFIFKEQQPSEQVAFEKIASYLPSDGKQTGTWKNEENKENTYYYNSKSLAKEFGSNYNFLASNAGDYVLLYKYDLKGVYIITISIGQKP